MAIKRAPNYVQKFWQRGHKYEITGKVRSFCCVEEVETAGRICTAKYGMLAINHISKAMKQPAVKGWVGLGVLMAGLGLNDYHQSMGDFDRKSFVRKDDFPPLNHVLDCMHGRTQDGQLARSMVVIERHRSEELCYIAIEVQLRIDEIRSDPEAQNMTQKTVDEFVMGELMGLAQCMCRRSMIRNGYVYQWFIAAVQDQILTPFVAPWLKLMLQACGVRERR